MILIAFLVLFVLGPLPIIMGVMSVIRDRREFTRFDR
jgi:hypothetical protein